MAGGGRGCSASGWWLIVGACSVACGGCVWGRGCGGLGGGREPAPGDFDTGEWKAGAVQDSEPVHAGTGGLLAGNGREYCAGISLYRTIRRRGAVEARAGSGAAVQGSSSPGASPGADRLLQRAGGGGAPVGSPLFRSKGISAAGAVLSGPGGGTGGAALAGVAL